MTTNIKKMFETVVENDYCIGCGVCAGFDDSPLEMKLDKYGKYRPFIKSENYSENLQTNVALICPFSSESKNETKIGRGLFEREGIKFNEYTGFFLKNYAGYVKESDYRLKGSSGGMGNWIAAQLLKSDLVDGIIHVKESNKFEGDILFEYQISYDIDELSSGAKSKYYPVELSKVINLVKKNEGRYALIGIPCFIKSIRLLASNDKIINNRIKYFIGLVCGHLKSDMFARSIAWQMGIEPNNLKGIDFRKKLRNRAANDYGVEVKGIINGTNMVLESATRDLYTTNWGLGFFKYNACEFCDDVLAETADITVGDAWLPEYTDDSLGTNIITVRNPDLLKILEQNLKQGSIHLDELGTEKIFQSQAGGFRHRRIGLAYRLHLKDEKKEWRPNKRVEPSDQLNPKRKEVYRKRMQLSQQSFIAYKIANEEKNFEAFIQHMKPFVEDYKRLIKPSLIKRIINKLKRLIRNSKVFS